MFDDEDEEYFEEINGESYNNNHINHKKESRNRFNMINYYEYFSEDALKVIDTFEISGENFLLESPENAVLYFDLKREEGTTTVGGYFAYTFLEDQAARTLKKKSVLNKTFKDIEMQAIADIDIGVESIEEGTFTVKLDSKEFNTSENYDEVRNYMLKFMYAIIIIQNTESYE